VLRKSMGDAESISLGWGGTVKKLARGEDKALHTGGLVLKCRIPQEERC